MDAAPSMVQRSGDSLIVYSPVSGNQIFKTNNNNENNNKSDDSSDNIKSSFIKLENNNNNSNTINHNNSNNNNNNSFDDDENLRKSSEKDEGLPQCKIKRNYSCSNCTFFTQNPRHYLIHLRDKHGEKIVINECKLCLYASRHYQKLVRHMKMVHGSTEGLDESSSGRKRQSNLNKLNNNNNNTNNYNNNSNNTGNNNNGGNNKKRKLISINESLTQQISNILNSNQLPPPLPQQQQQQPPSSSSATSSASPIFNALLQSQLNDNGFVGSIQQQQAAVAAALIYEQQQQHDHHQQQQQQQQQQQHQNKSTDNDCGTSASSGSSNIDKKLLKCSICDYTTIDRIKLIDHEKNDHIKTKFFRCIKCNYVTHIKARYSKHVKYHSMPMIKCIMCDFRTPYKWNLDRHMKNHGGTGPFKCSACNFTADIKQSLTVHEMNHHVPPVGHITNLVKRKNKVGGTDLTDDLLMMASGDGNNNSQHNLIGVGNSSSGGSGLNATGERHEIWPYMPLFLNTDDINNSVIDDNEINNDGSDISIQIPHDTSAITTKCIPPPLISPPSLLKTSIAMNLNESESQQMPTARKPKRPIPNLIPINLNSNNSINNNSNSSNNNSNNVLNLSMKKEPNSQDDGMAITNHFLDEMTNFHNQVAPTNIEEITKALQNSLKQFGILLNEGNLMPAATLQQQSTSLQQQVISCNSSESDRNSPASIISQASSVNHNGSSNNKAGSKKINFYDKLKENSLTGLSDTDKLVCRCGHVSKCLSESILHKKSCEGRFDDISGSINLTHSSNINSSTRCQYCRHRCKTSSDLMIHLQTCTEIQSNLDSIESSSDVTTNGGCGPDSKNDDEFDDVDDDVEDEGGADDDDDELMMGSNTNNEDDNESMDEALIDNPNEPHPMENVVFVWNKIPENKAGGGGGDPNATEVKKEICDDEMVDDKNLNESKTGKDHHHRGEEPNQYYAIETAPGYGEVTKEIKTLGELTNFSLKRVFKCPQCPFWASTASRFHVHIVGHLNQKPFECSLCSYRSNWRWDITKHIRLKTIRDPLHESAKVLMNDETGRRNYTKYNKYITLMKVTAENNETKFLKSGEMISLSHCQDDHQLTMDLDKSSGSITPNYSHIVSSPSTSSSPVSNNNTMNTASNLINLSSPEISIDNIGDSMKRMMESNPIDKKKTNFKCKKCNFRHNSRDVVLAHVKQHYRDAGISVDETNVDDTVTIASQNSISPPIISHELNPLSLLTPKIFLTTPIVDKSLSESPLKDELTNQQQQQQQHHYQQQQIISKIQLENPLINSQLTSSNMHHHTQQTSPSPQSLVIANSNQTSTTNNNNNNSNNNNNKNDHGDMDETNSGVSSVSGWRCPAPYRCGHCHQVSNWKHVIQRHCRLKHHGDIRIELFDKISLKNNKNATPNYQPLNVYNSHHKSTNSTNSNQTKSFNVTPSQQPSPTLQQQQSLQSPSSSNYLQTQQQLHIQSAQSLHSAAATNASIGKNECGGDIISVMEKHDEKAMLATTINLDNSNDDPDNNTDEDDELEENFDDYSTDLILVEREKNLLSPNKKFKCDKCPYVTDTKYQFMYHETFHKAHTKMPANYQCNQCSYNVTRKHLLNQHLRMHESSGPDGRLTTAAAAINSRRNSSQDDCDGATGDGAPTDDYELLYCQSCPGRFISEHEFVVHKKMHCKKFAYQCFLCTYTTKTMLNLNKHLYVHTNNYNLKTKEIEKKFCRINQNYPKPKIICINTSKNNYNSTNNNNNSNNNDSDSNNNNLYWIVITKSFINNLNNDKNNLINLDLDDMIKSNKVPILSQQQMEQPTHNSNNNNNNNSNSFLLQKQSQNKLVSSNNNSLLIGHNFINNLLNNSNNNNNNQLIEKCQYCPYTTNKKEIIKNHLHFHKIISGIERNLKCKHCDFSINDLKLFNDHTRLHFSSIQNLFNGNKNYNNNNSHNNNNNNNNSNVAFYTSFNDLEINFIKNINNHNNMDNIDPVSTTPITTQLVYKENLLNDSNNNNNNGDNNNDDNDNSGDSDENHEKIILNINSSDIHEN